MRARAHALCKNHALWDSAAREWMPPMRETEALIERIKRINADYQHLEVAVDASLQNIKPGESFLARFDNGWHPYLREHWWPVGVKGRGTLLVEREGTAHYEPGQVVNLLGPIGRPFGFRRSLRNVLLIAYDTPPTPLLMMIHWLVGNRIAVTLVLVGMAVDYDTAHLAPEVEIIRADDLAWPDQVLTLGWADQVFAVVRPDDELARFGQIFGVIKEKRNQIPNGYIFGVFQSGGLCGVGACYVCALRAKNELLLACLDGPAFDLTALSLPQGVL